MLLRSALVAAALAAAHGLAVVTPPPGRAAHAVQAAPQAFWHTEHVPETWPTAPEVARDCRGCHRFDGGAASPQQLCKACHERPPGSGAPTFLAVKPKPGWEQDLRVYRTRTGHAFSHTEHAKLACRECHPPQPAGVVPRHFRIETGPQSCVRCHAAPVTDEYLRARQRLAGAEPVRTGAALHAAFVAKINDGRLAPRDAARFLHTDHVPRTELQDGVSARCDRCHAAIQAAKVGEHGLAAKLAPAACGRCHRGPPAGAGAPPPLALVPTAREQRPSLTVGTFAHADHFRSPAVAPKPVVRDGAVRDELRERSCAACHVYAPAAGGDRPREFPFQDGGTHTYAACIRCHDVEAFRTQPGLHGNWSEPRGADGEHAACTACHAFGSGEMKGARAMDAVERVRPETRFRFATQAHPHVTAEGNRELERRRLKVEDCKECHKAGVERLPSRLGDRGRVFRHATHLPAHPGTAHCVRCHIEAERAQTPAALAASGGNLPRTWSLQACAECHFGDPVVEVAPDGESRTTTRDVLRFAHGDHVGKEVRPGETLSCTSCHALGEGGVDVLVPGASSCKSCHDHDAAGDRWQRTGGVKGSEVTSCASCHRTGVPPLRGHPDAKADARWLAPHDVFGGFVPRHQHPAPTADDCVVCHELPATGPAVAVEDHLPCELRRDVAGYGLHKLNGDDYRPANCFACHWRRPLDVKRWEPWSSRVDPEAVGVREHLGNDLDAFPGREAQGTPDPARHGTTRSR